MAESDEPRSPDPLGYRNPADEPQPSFTSNYATGGCVTAVLLLSIVQISVISVMLGNSTPSLGPRISPAVPVIFAIVLGGIMVVAHLVIKRRTGSASFGKGLLICLGLVLLCNGLCFIKMRN